MPETTQQDQLQALRFNANKEAAMKNQSDEEIVEEIADYIMVASQSFASKSLSSRFMDIANKLIQQKTILAQGANSIEEEEDMQGAPMSPGMGVPPGMMPPPQM